VKPHAFHPQAAEEYANAAEFYARISPELATRFYDEIERLIEDVRRAGDRFRVFEGKARRHFSDVFPYAIIYLDQPDRIWIVAVMHFKRAPGYWRKRLT
jgi:toxin ParE1/3/4